MNILQTKNLDRNIVKSQEKDGIRIKVQVYKEWDFPGDPVVKNLTSSVGDGGSSLLCQGTKISHAGATRPLHHN